MVATRVEIDLCVDRSSHEVTAVAAHQIVLFTFLLDTELEHERIFASQAFKVARIELRQDNDDWPTLGDIQDELGAVVIGRPGDIQGGPLLGDGPLGSKEASPVKVLVFLEQVTVRDPEKLMIVST